MNNTNIKESWAENIYSPDENNRPVKKDPVVTLNGETILTNQTITCLVAAPGQGKSSNCEAIILALLKPDFDNLGYKVSEQVKAILYIDFERPHDQIWEIHNRVCSIAGISMQSKIFKMCSMRNEKSANEKRNKIELLVQMNKPDLLILDGAGDLVDDQNDSKESGKIIQWFRKMTTSYQLSVFTTLHPNKSDRTPRGHIGSYLIRESQFVYTITGKEIKKMTNDFDHGKNSHGGIVESSMKWNVEMRQFVSCCALVKEKVSKTPQESLSDSELKALILHKNFLGGMNKENTRTTIKNEIKRLYPNLNSGTKTTNELIKILIEKNYLIVKIEGRNRQHKSTIKEDEIHSI